jgi:thioesterase domain-containing protein
VATGGLAVYLVPGAHYNMLREPHVQTLAAQLRTCVANALTL